ncbi:MAG: hypothetical protein WA101_00730 [Minisyncoccia bacterium]
MKRKSILILATLLMIVAGLSMQEVTIAQNVKGGWFEKQPKEKKEKEEKEPGNFNFKTDISYSHRRDVVMALGVNYKGSASVPPVNLMLSFSSPRTSFGAKIITYPFKTLNFVGIGIEGIYYYKSNLDLYSEFFYGGKVKNTFGSPETTWDTKRLAIAPTLEIFIPSDTRYKFGVRMNPLIFGYWDYDSDAKKWGAFRRYYDISLYFTIDLGKKSGAEATNNSGSSPVIIE